jgi:MFS family permease
MKLHSLRAFRHRNYRLFFSGQSLSVIGTWIQQIAMAWLVYRLTGSAWLLGVTGFASQIAVLVLAPLGGLWADRVDRRKLLVALQTLALVQAFALAALTYADAVEVWHVITMALLLGVVTALDVPIRQSFTIEMVPDKADLPSAIAFNGFMQNSGRMIGPTLAGLLLLATSEAFCFLLNGLSKLAVLTVMGLMSLPRQRKAQAARVWASMRQGAAYGWRLAPVRHLLPVVGFVSFLATPYQTLMPIFAAEVFGGGAETLGFLVGAAGLGGVIGGILLAARPDVRGLTRWTLAGALTAGVATAAFAYSQWLPLSLILIAGTGFGVIVTANSVSMIVQTIVDDDKRGRVMGFYAAAFLGTQPVGSLAAGAIASAIGATHTLALGGLGCLLVAAALSRRLPMMRAELRELYAKAGVTRANSQGTGKVA